MFFKDLPESVNSVKEIEEIVEKYQIPMREKCRFFINENYMEPKAFGIYREGDVWIVYKNKANGQRVIRYRGKSETYAAQEIWDKFLDENDLRTAPRQTVSIGETDTDIIKGENVTVTRTNTSETPEDHTLSDLISDTASFVSNNRSKSKDEGPSKAPIILLWVIIIFFLLLAGGGSGYSGSYDDDWSSSSWDDSDWGSDWDSSDTDWDSDW